MKWAHLPVAGGIYEQHPQLLARWQYIFGRRAEQQEKERREQERKSQAQRGSPRKTAGRRR
jgi:hypothetical protein